MANNVLLLTQSKVKEITDQMATVRYSALDTYKRYFATNASTVVNALLLGTTPATYSSALSKQEVIDGITLCDTLNNFFGNLTVTTADNTQRAMNLTNGGSQAAQPLDQDLEAIGLALKQLGTDCLTIKSNCKDIQKLYFSSVCSAVVGAISSSDVLPGAEVTASEASAAVTMVQEFIDLMDNAAVTQADYASTLAKWQRISA